MQATLSPTWTSKVSARAANSLAVWCGEDSLPVLYAGVGGAGEQGDNEDLDLQLVSECAPGQQQKVVTVTPGAHNLLHLSLQHGQQDKQLLQLLCGTGDSLIVWQAAAAPTAAGPVHHISAQAVLLVHNSCSAVAYPHSVQADTNAQEQSKLWRPLCAALSGCGGICYAGFASGHICAWRADTGKHLRSMAGHTAAVMCLSLAQSGHMLLSGSDDKSIRAWSTGDGACLQVLRGHTGSVRAVASTPDAELIFSCGTEGAIKVWHAARGLSMGCMQGRHPEGTWAQRMLVTPCGCLLITGSTGPFGGSTIMVFDIVRGRPGAAFGKCLAVLRHLQPDEPGSITALAISSDSRQLFSGSSTGTVAAWDMTGPMPPTRVGTASQLSSCAAEARSRRMPGAAPQPLRKGFL